MAFLENTFAIFDQQDLWGFRSYMKFLRDLCRNVLMGYQIQEMKVHVFGTTFFLQVAEDSFTHVTLCTILKDYLWLLLGPYNDVLNLALVGEMDPMHSLTVKEFN
jgi:hypothetical protein